MDNKKELSTNLLNLDVYARVAFYGLMIGFIYNYVYFNLCLDFNIFDAITANELLFSWIGVSSLLATVISWSFIYVFIIFINKLNKTSLIIFLILSILIASIDYCFLKGKSFDIYLAIMMASITVFVSSLMLIILPSEVDNIRPKRIEIIVLVSLISFTIIFAATEVDKLFEKNQQIKINFKSNYENKAFQDKELYYIGKTNSMIILSEQEPQKAKENKDFITIYTTDISSIKYISKNKNP